MMGSKHKSVGLVIPRRSLGVVSFSVWDSTQAEFVEPVKMLHVTLLEIFGQN